MPRAQPKTSHRHKRVIAAAKGYYGRRKNTFRVAKQAVDRAREYSYRDRRTRKRDMRALWIQRINAASRSHGLTYAQFMHGIKKSGIALDRKMLADLAIAHPASFKSLVDSARKSA